MLKRLFSNLANKNVAVVGLSYGDEGKAKIVDVLAANRDIVCRFSGGSNAGHSVVVNNKKTIFRLLPSGALHKDKLCILGHGMVIDPKVLKTEIELLTDGGLQVKNRVYIANNAHIVMPYHFLIDEAREKTISDIGTTKKGIGPAYEDKIRRTGIRMEDLLDQDILEKKIENSLKHWEPILRHFSLPVYSAKTMAQQYHEYGDYFASNVHDTVNYLNTTMKSIVFEGAQGAGLDIDNGTYPYVTSSSASVGGILTGTGVSHKKIHEVIGVIKAYSTRVGGGPFSTEINNDVADRIREIGAEYGSVTKRPRRVGWLDLPEIKKAIQINGVDNIALTKIDVLSTLPEIKVKTHDGADLMTIPGWESNITACTNFKDMPEKAKCFVKLIQECLETKVSMISIGCERDAIIHI